MKNKNKFQTNDKVSILATGQTVTVNKFKYVPNMKRYSYTVNENPQTFYFEEELEAKTEQ
ncbi:hypothetical protein BKP37_04705 [Anaerobacillus alkalilacustris]|uniref:Uncharacterized protein n=1 Tax=Anaerobacillus alkalilacustris TaxID=393763 RepID=A0A1S2LZE2_9BACI|nr:hypothetical protein [Anaerobacillus alkalilacustris]OIJ16835.1 hypothetical protein BKP37_04705 [Anaerobacillus alkalilacustris]